MRTAFIVNQTNNESLLRFTETKLFFDANNQATNFVSDCVIVDSIDKAMELAKAPAVILNTGEFLTTTYRNKNAGNNDILIASGDPDIIVFDLNTYIGFQKRCKYLHGSKQLYIIENLLKTCLRNKDLVYLDNTEEVGELPTISVQHLYGLASGWKTIQLAEIIGMDKLETITVYDLNLTQLNHARWLHENSVLPDTAPTYKNVCGEYQKRISAETWNRWHNYPVNFKQIDLFSIPNFPTNSLVWISNVFMYEPNIFKFGWNSCKEIKKRLIELNKDSIII